MYRLILIGVTAVIVKVGLTTFGVELTWLQAIVATILAQMFAFMFSGLQPVNIGVIRTKEDDVE
ncbi:hypothetical protein [Lederbergia citri]|uniref:Uncharacterized protein n=1 Tax=Lederbergia citri TaxID=2833580 RepID=A0A942TFQ2_9BACI|nr:hypothetical protein [Lederbergia citri]MBS4195367.1 hypothetical protein [Lederbergia citri]